MFKEGTTAEVLAQKKAWVEQAIAQYLQNLQFLNQPMPEPVVYTFIADKYKRTSAFWEDTNVGIKGTVALSVWKEGETITAAEHSHLLWEKPDFTGDWNTYAFVQDKEFPFNREHAVNNARFTYVQYPEPNGTFKKLNFQIGGDFYEADDLDSPDHICGNNVIQDAKTFLGTTAVNTDKTGTFDIIDNCDNERQKINITYKVKREPSEFAGLVGN